jgi:hypothetical protein
MLTYTFIVIQLLTEVTNMELDSEKWKLVKCRELPHKTEEL